MDDPTPHLERFSSYDQAIREFQWRIPQTINIASAVCRRHADSVTRIALSDVRIGGVNTYTFGGLDYLSDKFASALTECNINPGDAVAVALRPCAALAVAQLGTLKTGGVVVPLSPNATPDFVEHVLRASDAKILVLDESLIVQYSITKKALRRDVTTFVVRDLRPTMGIPYKDFWSEVDRCSSAFTAREPESNSAVFTLFIETQGKISGVVHSARSVICQLAAFEFFSEFDHNAVFWAGDDWTSPATILGTIYPAWWYGCSIIANSSEKENSVSRLLAECEVTNVFQHTKAMQLADELSKVVNSTMMHEVFGTPESGWIIGQSNKWIQSAVPLLCRVVPGRRVDIIDGEGNPLRPGLVGQIAIHKSDPGLFTGYQGEAADVLTGDWFLIGEFGYKTEAGELRLAHQNERTENYNGC
jgi:acetyl-CoA synthetase